MYYSMDMVELGKKIGNELAIDDQLSMDHQAVFLNAWKKVQRFGIYSMINNYKGNMNKYWNDIVSLIYGIGLGSTSIGIIFSMNVQLWACIFPIMKYSNQANKHYLKGLMNGELIGAHAISENNAGSDVFNISTEYEETEYGYKINGYKNYITNAPYADLYLVYAKKKGSKGYRGISCFLVDKSNSGLQVGELIPKMGMEFSPMASVYFNDCIVPKDAIVGQESQGVFIFNLAMMYERPLLLVFQVGLMENQMNRNVDFCKERMQGGKRIIDYQAVSNRLADMKVNLEACKLFIADIAKKLIDNSDSFESSSIAKLFISEKLVENSILAMKNYGAYGYLKGCIAEQNLRDSLGAIFYSGTSDIQRNIIAKSL